MSDRRCIFCVHRGPIVETEIKQKESTFYCMNNILSKHNQVTKNMVCAYFTFKEQPVFVDYSPIEACTNDDTYGSVCLQCNQCGRFTAADKPDPDGVIEVKRWDKRDSAMWQRKE